MKNLKKKAQVEKLQTLRPHVLYLDVVEDNTKDIYQNEFMIDIPYYLIRRKENEVKSELCVCVAFNHSMTHVGFCVNSFDEPFLRYKAYDKATGRFIRSVKTGDLIEGPQTFGDKCYHNLQEKVLNFLENEWRPVK